LTLRRDRRIFQGSLSCHPDRAFVILSAAKGLSVVHRDPSVALLVQDDDVLRSVRKTLKDHPLTSSRRD
jgi:hypothetical protein